MGFSIKFLIIIAKFFKFTSPIFGFVYLINWFIYFININVFDLISHYLGYLPNYFMTFFSFLNSYNLKISIGHILSALFCFIITFFAYKADEFLQDLKSQVVDVNDDIKNIENVNLTVKESNIKQNEEKENYGLFEIFFENCLEKDNLKIERLKNEYCQLISQKLAQKYSDVEFIVKDKIFFKKVKQEELDNFIEDFIKIYMIFNQANQKNNIKTSFNFSFITESEAKSNPSAYEILNQINDLKIKNKILVSSSFVLKYNLLNSKKFDFEQLKQEHDIHFGLFYITFAKTN